MPKMLWFFLGGDNRADGSLVGLTNDGNQAERIMDGEYAVDFYIFLI